MRTIDAKPITILAWCTIPLFAYQAWTIAGWLADGPHQITQYRDRDSASWVAARIIEGAIVVSMLVIAWLVIRDCRRKGRLTFDAMLIAGIASAAFWDPIYNWDNTAWLYSSNWVNLNDWFGYAPFVANPDAGHQPWPIGPVLIGYAFWGLGFAFIENRIMDRARTRWSLSTGALVALAYVLSGTITVLAFGVFKVLDLMHAPGYRAEFLLDSELIVFFYSGALVFGTFSVIRYFGLLERGDHGTGTRLLATIAACQLVVVLGWGVLTVPLSLDPAPWPQTPAHLVNGATPSR